MPFINFTPSVKSGRGKNLHHEEVEVVMDDVGSVMIDDTDTSDDSPLNESINDEDVCDEQHWISSSDPSFSSTSSSTSSSLFGRLFPFHRAMEDAKKIVFHPTQAPPRVDEFDWKVEFQPATCSGSKRTSEEASAPSEPMMMTSPPRRRNNYPNQSGHGRGVQIDNSSPFRHVESASFKMGRIVTAEKVTAPRRDDDNSSVNPFEHNNDLPLEYSRPAKRCRVEGGTNCFGSTSLVTGILRPASQSTTNEDDCFSSPIITSYNRSLDRTSGSVRQQESTKKKNKRLRFIDSRLSLVRRLKVGNLINYSRDSHGGGGGGGSRKRNGDLVFGAEENDDEDGFQRYINEEVDESWSQSSNGSSLFQRFGKKTMAEF